jgi:hypothetical protein
MRNKKKKKNLLLDIKVRERLREGKKTEEGFGGNVTCL